MISDAIFIEKVLPEEENVPVLTIEECPSPRKNLLGDDFNYEPVSLSPPNNW